MIQNENQIKVLILPLTFSMALTKSLHPSEPLIPPVLQKENNTECTSFLWGCLKCDKIS